VKLRLIRMSESEYGTFGRLETEEREQLCYTLEEPWRNNARGISCIPAGTYTAFRRFSPSRKRWVYELRNVPGRSNIQIHIGNTLADILGCILVGSAVGKVTVKGVSTPGLLRSREAFDRVMAHLAGYREFQLEIVNFE
jgi:hypothetical protein